MAKANPKTPAKRARKAKALSSALVPPQDIAEQQMMIAEAAYFIAEQRGFSAGGELSDWLQAEREVQTHLSEQ